MTEVRILKDRGARVHPMSGGGSIKEDGSDEHCLYEIKDARKTYQLKASELIVNYRRAVAQGKMGVFIVYFSDLDVTAEIRLSPGGRELLGESGH